MVFDAIVSGPREESRSESVPEIEAGTALAIESADAEIEGEVIDPDDGDPSVGLDAEEIEAIDADGYTDADAEIMSESSGTTTSDPDDSSLSGALSPDPLVGYPGVLGPTGPAGSGLLSLQDAVEATAAMRGREAARLRNTRRR